MKKTAQSQILKLANKLMGGFGPDAAQRAVNALMVQQAIFDCIKQQKEDVANDNNNVMSRHLLDQLADIIGFMAAKKKMDVSVMATLLLRRFEIARLSDLRDDQFQDALDCVLTWKTEYAI